MVCALGPALTALAYSAMLGVQTVSSDPNRVIAGTQYGPLTEGDRDFVVKVRSAGVWEYPLGELALQKGSTEEIREAGRHLIVGHAGLGELCRKIAPMLNITLPNRPSPRSATAPRTRWYVGSPTSPQYLRSGACRWPPSPSAQE